MKQLLLLTVFLITQIASELSAATYYARATGNWNTASTWSTASCSGAAAATIPGVGDDVVVCSNYVVTLNASASCNNLNVQNTGTLQLRA